MGFRRRGRQLAARGMPDAMAPVVAVPTTSGTGSEVGRAAVIIDEETRTPRGSSVPPAHDAGHGHRRSGAWSPGCRPHITAATGMDAFAHCLEAYSATGNTTPWPTASRWKACAWSREWLPVAVAGRRQSRGARPHDGRRRHGGDGLPEGPRRHPRPQPPGRRGVRYPTTGSPTRCSCPTCSPSTARPSKTA